MKKLTILLSILIASISANAESTLQITLSSASQANKVLQIVVDNPFSDAYDNGYDATIGANQEGGLYIYTGSERYSLWATNAIAKNLPMGFGSVADDTYTLSFQYFTGTPFEIYDRTANKTITVNSASNILIDGVAADPANKYTFTLGAGENHNTAINNRFFFNYTTASIKGADAWWTLPYDVDLALSADGKTATGTLDFDGKAGEYYTFGVKVNENWTGDNAAFTRDANSRAISGDQNMWFEIEDGTVDYEYTFTWTFATNTLTIGYPDEVPAPTCTTVRTGLNVDQFYTICLPKAVTAANGASFWNMTNRGEGVAYLVEAELPLVAGRPYIFQAEDDELCVTYSGDEVAACAYGALVGTFAAMDQAALNAAGTDIYLLKDNELWLVSGQTGNSLAANRAYIKYSELVPGNPQAAAPGRRVRAIPMQGQTATGVENLNASEAPAKMIIDGKMVIIRGEHMFDATGRMVK